MQLEFLTEFNTEITENYWKSKYGIYIFLYAFQAIMAEMYRIVGVL